MRVVILEDAEAVAEAAADEIAGLLQANPRAVLALPTGSTPLGMYRRLAGRNLDWSQVTTFNLDEYVGLAESHPASYHAYMREHLLGRTNLPPANCRVPDGQALDLTQACLAYEQEIAARGGLDLAILGIGLDGHVAFNEPPSSLAGRTRVVRLAPSTRRVNAAHFPPGESLPQQAITMGIGTLLEARRLLLLATGAAKAEILARAVEGPLSALVPASCLQLHCDPVVLVDRPAAARLNLLDYYLEAYPR